MVGADGSRADEAHAAAVEQGGIAAGAGTDDECVGLVDGLAGDVGRLEIVNLGARLDDAADVGYVIIYNDSHGKSMLVMPSAKHPAMNNSIEM